MSLSNSIAARSQNRRNRVLNTAGAAGVPSDAGAAAQPAITVDDTTRNSALTRRVDRIDVPCGPREAWPPATRRHANRVRPWHAVAFALSLSGGVPQVAEAVRRPSSRHGQ